VSGGVLRRITALIREKVVRGGSEVLKDELQNLFSSPNITIIKSRMRWVEHAAYMGERENVYKREETN
jgi:hypothetical protein